MKEILERAVANGGYEAALLSDGDGLTLAAVEAGEKAGMMAAMTSLLGD